MKKCTFYKTIIPIYPKSKETQDPKLCDALCLCVLVANIFICITDFFFNLIKLTEIMYYLFIRQMPDKFYYLFRILFISSRFFVPQGGIRGSYEKCTCLKNEHPDLSEK